MTDEAKAFSVCLSWKQSNETECAWGEERREEEREEIISGQFFASPELTSQVSQEASSTHPKPFSSLHP